MLDVLAEILDGVFTTAGGVDRGVPIHLHQLPEQARVDQAVVTQRIGKERPESIGQLLCIDQELGIFQVLEFVLRVQTDRRQDVMDVRMEPHFLGPALVNAEEAVPLKARAFRIGQQAAQGLRTAFEKQLHGGAIAEQDGAQLLGQREGDHEVRHRQQFAQSFIHPLGGIGCAALRTQSMVATMEGMVRLPTTAGIERCPPNACVRHWRIACKALRWSTVIASAHAEPRTAR